MKIAGIDIGTTACKVSLYEDTGKLLAECEREYPSLCRKSATEIDMEGIFQSVCSVLEGVSRQADGLAAIGVTSFGETFVLLDESDAPLMLSMLYTDPRGTEQSDRLAAEMGDMRVASITGAYPNPMYSLPKLMWIAENRPDILEKTKHIMLVQDYVVFRLSGERQIDASLAARTMAMDLARQDWNGEMLRHARVRPEMLPRIVPSGTVAGEILPSLAEKLGLPGKIQIVSGCHDQIAACIGAGVLRPGMAADGSGTVQCITPVYRGIPDAERIQQGRYAVVPFVHPGEYVSYAFSFTGGALLKWFRDEMMKRPGDSAFYEEMNAAVPSSPTGMLVLPHFAGAGTPYMDPAAEGAIVGLKIGTTAQDLYRAMMEGVAYEMRVNMECLARAGVAVDGLMASGGGARSVQWLQIKADVLNTPITTLGTAQCGTLGSIILSGHACGAYASLEEGAQVFVHPGRVFEPRPEVRAQYDEIYARYKNLYQAVRTLA